MSMFTSRAPSSPLSDSRAAGRPRTSRTPAQAIVRTGLVTSTSPRSMHSPRVGALVDDDVAFMHEIDAAVDSFWDDVVRDRCASRTWYNVDSKSWVVPSPELRASLCKGPRSTDVVKERPATSPEWLTSLGLWMQDWRNFMKAHSVDAVLIGSRPNREDLDVWKKQLDGPDGWREQFVKAGGLTIRPKADSPASGTGIPWTGVLLVAGVIAAALLLRSLPFGGGHAA